MVLQFYFLINTWSPRCERWQFQRFPCTYWGKERKCSRGKDLQRRAWILEGKTRWNNREPCIWVFLGCRVLCCKLRQSQRCL